jgi:hypothetical protein
VPGADGPESANPCLVLRQTRDMLVGFRTEDDLAILYENRAAVKSEEGSSLGRVRPARLHSILNETGFVCSSAVTAPGKFTPSAFGFRNEILRQPRVAGEKRH